MKLPHQFSESKNISKPFIASSFPPNVIGTVNQKLRESLKNVSETKDNEIKRVTVKSPLYQRRERTDFHVSGIESPLKTLIRSPVRMKILKIRAEAKKMTKIGKVLPEQRYIF